MNADIKDQCPHCGCLRDDNWLRFIAWANAQHNAPGFDKRDLIRSQFLVSRATAYRWIRAYSALRALHGEEFAA